MQGVLEAAVAQVTREQVRVQAAGRTDSGVRPSRFAASAVVIFCS